MQSKERKCVKSRFADTYPLSSLAAYICTRTLKRMPNEASGIILNSMPTWHRSLFH